MSKYYPLEKAHNYIKKKNWTILCVPAENQPNYKIFYKDSEWNEASDAEPPAAGTFTKLTNAFDDGTTWFINGQDGNSTGTFTCVVVRLSDRKAIKCVGVASNQKLCEDARWTVTDITGDVWHDELRRLRLLGNI